MKNKRIQVMLTEEEYKKLLKNAEEIGLSVSVYVRMLLKTADKI